MADTPDTEAPRARGPFIVLEGIDGAGTTTQLNALREHFRQTGRKAFFTHEPSDGPVGMLIRLALQGRLAGGRFALHDPADAAQPASADFDRTALALLFAADRADHVATQVQPNLDAGRIVVCDRYILSTLAYQGLTPTLSLDWLIEINRQIFRPDLTFFLDVPPQQATVRMRQTRWKRDLYELPEQQLKIREKYLELIEQEIPVAGPVVVIDAARRPADVAKRIKSVLERFLESGRVDNARVS